jgi:hypothetical protein
MATDTVSENGNGINGIPKGYDIVAAPSGTGRYDVCGKCGCRLHTDKLELQEREKMAEEIEKNVINPLALLAGLLANVVEEDLVEGLNIVAIRR